MPGGPGLFPECQPAGGQHKQQYQKAVRRSKVEAAPNLELVGEEGDIGSQERTHYCRRPWHVLECDERGHGHSAGTNFVLQRGAADIARTAAAKTSRTTEPKTAPRAAPV